MLKSKDAFTAVRFEGFELDLHSGELRKDGTPTVRLPEQSFQILAMLLERAGKVVSRSEIQEQLWPDGTVVEFEHSIGAAMNRLRQVLGDSAENAQYIETLTRRGYRWIAGAEWVKEPVSPESAIPVAIDRQEIQRGKNLLKRGSVVVAVGVLLLICAAIWYSRPQRPTVTNAVRITNDGKAKSSSHAPVTDGVRLYFVEGMPWTTGSGIAQLSASGGETTWITTTLQEPMAILGISPDRSELLVQNGAPQGLFASEGEIWVQPLPAGAPHRVGNIVASAACWTPDGMHIVYAYSQGITDFAATKSSMATIMIVNKDGSEPHQLARASGVVRALRVSPDGRRIRFYVLPFLETSSIWEMDADGEHLHALFPNWKESPFQCCGNWSPDGDYYYFEAGHGNDQAIWLMPERRSIFRRAAASPSRLTSEPLRFSLPVPSADGKRLFVMGDQPRVELSRYDLQARRFDPYLGGLSAGSVGFSSDRKWIAYVTYPDMTLWRSRMDGSEKLQLTFSPVRAYGPRWSPDGSKIVFMDIQFNRPAKISLVSSSGGIPELLGQASTDESEDDPTWTPDGESVVFGKLDANHNVAIYRLDLKIRKASSIPDSDGFYSPRVSPDGRYISALATPQLTLMLFDTSTNHWSSLAEGTFGNNEWSPDGKYVYMRTQRGGAPEVVRVRIKDRVMEDVVSLKDFPQLSDGVAQWIGLAPDGAPLLMRDRSVQEIYALDLRFH